MGTPVPYWKDDGTTGWSAATYTVTQVRGTVSAAGGTGTQRITFASGTDTGLKAFVTDRGGVYGGPVVDGEICATVNTPNGTGVKGGVCARMSKTGDISGYLVQETTAGNASSWDLISYTDNDVETYTTIGRISPAGVSAYPARIRYAYIGSTHWVKVWDPSGAEPAWTASTGNVMRIIDSTKTTGGASGAHAWSLTALTQYVEFDNLEWTAHNPIVARPLVTLSANTNDGSTFNVTFNDYANAVGLIWAGWTKGSAPDAATVSLSGVTFNKLSDVSYATTASPNKRLAVWSYKIGNSDITGSNNLDFAFSANQTGFIYGQIRLGGADNTSSDGSGAFLNAATNTPGSAGASNSVSISSFTNPYKTSGVVGVMGLNANTTITADSNADYSSQVGHANPAHAAMQQFFDANESSVDFSWTNNFTSTGWAAEVAQQDTSGFYSGPSLVTDPRRVRRNVNLRR